MGALARTLQVIVELWLPAIILLVALTLILGVKRIWTVLGLVAVGLLVFAIGRRIATTPDVQLNTSPATITPAAAIESLPVDQAEITDLKITGSTAPWSFTGTVINRNPEHTLLSATIHVIRRDCYEGALDPSGCVTLWETKKRVNLQIPPGKQQSFVEQMSPRGSVARPKGVLKDEFEVLGLTGRPAAASP
jgi:hypothetical protein